MNACYSKDTNCNSDILVKALGYHSGLFNTDDNISKHKTKQIKNKMAYH